MSKDSRSGGKFVGHTTLIPLAAQVCDTVRKIVEVSKIAPGFITSGLTPANGRRRVKVADEGEDCLLLSVRDNTSHQEIRLYVVANRQEIKTMVARRLRDNHIAICFPKPANRSGN